MTRRAVVGFLVGVSLLSPSAIAQQVADQRLAMRLTGMARDVVTSIVDSARRDGIPTEPLIDRALQGASIPGMLPARIISSVRRLDHDLRRARQALGAGATEAEVKAGAYALAAGADIKQLEKLRGAKVGQRYAMALDVLTYIMSRGVRADTASSVIVSLVLASATDQQLTALQETIDRDIAGGTRADLAVSARGQGLLTMIAAAQTTHGVAPSGTLPSGLGTTRSADPAANGALSGGAAGSMAGSGSKPAPAGKSSKKP